MYRDAFGDRLPGDRVLISRDAQIVVDRVRRDGKAFLARSRPPGIDRMSSHCRQRTAQDHPQHPRLFARALRGGIRKQPRSRFYLACTESELVPPRRCRRPGPIGRCLAWWTATVPLAHTCRAARQRRSIHELRSGRCRRRVNTRFCG